ncbi:restriction endonuclease [Halobacillus litoralis]|uniref:restriction endonuclease n=1 Tax=Halobacillus litoralis TaxID=45668 RepID=UPI00249385C3|nr:restriction endonuclease [Halobacillus litoralis]
MDIPNHQKFRLPLLELIQDGDKYVIKDCIDRLGDYFNLSDEKRNEMLPRSNRTRLYDRVYWAKTHLIKAGIIRRFDDSTFSISNEGKGILKMNLQMVDDEFLRQYSGYKQFIEKSRNKVSNKIAKLNHANEPKYLDHLLKLRGLSSEDFEEKMLSLLFHLGYGQTKENVKSNIRKTNDWGLDGYIELDPLGLDKLYIQAKRWNQKSVGIEYIQRFSGSIDSKGGNKGIFITTSSFTRDAKDCCEEIKNNSLLLLDGFDLVKLMLRKNFEI